MSKEAKPEGDNARDALKSNKYFEVFKHYDEELHELTEKI